MVIKNTKDLVQSEVKAKLTIKIYLHKQVASDL